LKIISGGQTGADRAGLDVAIALGIPHGGWCPKGRRAEDGAIPAYYRMEETETDEYPERTGRNVESSDGTVVFTRGEPRGGSALTLALARKRHKAALHVDLSRGTPVEIAAAVRAFVDEKGISVLNVAGSREGESPGIHAAVLAILREALRPGAPAPASVQGRLFRTEQVKGARNSFGANDPRI